MSNIIGESFDDYVKTQVDVRQKVLGLTNRRPEDLVYLNSKTAWLRLASSVDIDGKYFVNTNPISSLQSKTGDILATQFVLFGGTSDGGKNLATGSFGVIQSNIFDNQTYGLGGIEDYGFKPMAGLNSAKVTSYNRGSLRKATIKITANNPQQFYIIDTLYMKLGYTVLLEWGWTIYKDNKGVNQTVPNNNVFNAFLKGTTFNSVLTELENTRINTSCNQDGFIGYVTNFRWSFSQDGLYDIEIDVVSIGSVIESLNINKIYSLGGNNLSTPNTPSISPVQTPASNPFLNRGYNQLTSGLTSGSMVSTHMESKLLNFLYNCEFEMSINEPSPSDYQKSDIDYLDSKYNDKVLLNLYKFFHLDVIRDDNVNVFSPNRIKYKYVDGGPIPITDDKLTPLLYIKLGALLDFINNELLLYCPDPSSNIKENIIKIYTDPYNNTSNKVEFVNKFYLPPYALSGDPTVCVVPFVNLLPDGTSYYFNANYILGDDIKAPININSFNATDKLMGFIGNLMNLPVGLSFIEETFMNSKNELNAVSLYSFLDNLMQGINRALGGINKFEIIYDDANNLVKIVDTTNIPGTQTSPSSVINVNGVYKSKAIGSFVRNISLNSELSNQMASMVAIGAQAQGIKVPQDSTAFSKWYEGLKDRIIPYKLDRDDVDQNIINPQPTKTVDDILTERYNKNLELLQNYITSYGNLPDIPDMLALYTDIMQYRNGLFVQQDAIGIQGFIPLNLNLTMDGISGMKIYQKFKITQDILPPLYPKKLNFLIKGIDHEIDRNGWRTNIQTFSIGTDISKVVNLDKIKGPTPAPTPTTTLSSYPVASSSGPAANSDEVVRLFAFLIAAWKQAGYKVTLTSGFRTYNEQKDLYNKWLADPNRNPRLKPALPGTSQHESGKAIDVILVDKNGITLNANSPLRTWTDSDAVKIAKKLGFRWGGDFSNQKDVIHFDLLGASYNKAKSIITNSAPGSPTGIFTTAWKAFEANNFALLDISQAKILYPR
jgi:hypothetical protein